MDKNNNKRVTQINFYFLTILLLLFSPVIKAAVPSAPIMDKAIAGNGNATVNFLPPVSDGGSPIINYTATSSPGGFTGNSLGTSIIVNGLSNGTSYTFTVTATNADGTGPASAASNSVTPKSPQTITFNNPGAQTFGTTPTLIATASSGLPVSFSSSTTGVCTITSGGTLSFITAGSCTIIASQTGNASYDPAPPVNQTFIVNPVVPGAPAIGSATAGSGSATVSFTPPASNGGSAISSYTVTANPGGQTASGSASPITVTGLTNGTAYAFTVTATNSAGNGPASALSNSVTPTTTQTISFNNPGPQLLGTSPTLAATASSGLPVSFSSTTPGICTISSSGTLSFLTTGTCSITASQPGDAAYTPAPDVSQSFSVTTASVVPVAPALSATVPAGETVKVDLTSAASGGPFTGATIVSLSPANLGVATIENRGTTYILSFSASAIASGNVIVKYTLSNAAGISAESTVTLTLIPLLNPARDSEVLGVLNAQVRSVRRVMQGQIMNFQRRLETLHNNKLKTSNNISFNPSNSNDNPFVPASANRPANHAIPMRELLGGGSPGVLEQGAGISLPWDGMIWTDGIVDFGKTDGQYNTNEIRFTTAGISMGLDKQINKELFVGAGLGYGRDLSDIGHKGSRSQVNSYNIALYASYSPYKKVFLDMLLSNQWLSFEARRYVTNNGMRMKGDRHGSQQFGFLSLALEQSIGSLLVSPYARLDLANARLNTYGEKGAVNNILQYKKQSLQSTRANLGLRGELPIRKNYGLWLPTLRLEYGHEFQDDGIASMTYPNILGSPVYFAPLNNMARDYVLFGPGLKLETLKGWLLRFEYLGARGSDSKNQLVLLGIERIFKEQ